MISILLVSSAPEKLTYLFPASVKRRSKLQRQAHRGREGCEDTLGGGLLLEAIAVGGVEAYGFRGFLKPMEGVEVK